MSGRGWLLAFAALFAVQAAGNWALGDPLMTSFAGVVCSALIGAWWMAGRIGGDRG